MFQKFRFDKKGFSPPAASSLAAKSSETQLRLTPSSATQSTAPAVDTTVKLQGDEACPNGHDELASSVDEDLSQRSSTAASSGEAVKASRKRKKAGEYKLEVFDKDLKGLPERLGDKPLRAIIVGTNPSGHAWRTGHYYSNPNNNMWKILRQTGIAPPSISGAQDDVRMPEEAGIGFCDVGCGIPGTHLHKFSSETMQGWGSGFFIRLSAHMKRANDYLGCTCGRCGAPSYICYAGKRQWMELLNTGKKGREKLSKIEQGRQMLRPQGWPLPASTEVWVLPSTSGAAAMTVEERVGPYREMAAKLAAVQWPREEAKCKLTKTEDAAESPERKQVKAEMSGDVEPSQAKDARL